MALVTTAAIFTGVGGDEMREPKVEIDQLAEALKLRPSGARNGHAAGGQAAPRDFRRFE